MFPPAIWPRPIAVLSRVFARQGLALILLAGTAMAQTALEPDQGGVDFKIQGEYSGKVETVTPMGAQVIAQGSGQFKAVFFPGGLPGQGWNGTGRIEATGTLQNGVATFSGGGYSATIGEDGTLLNGKTDKAELFSFNKIMRASPTEGAPAPAGAIVLFDGAGVSAWKDGTATMDARKLFKPEGATATDGAVSKQAFQDFTLHLEFREPFMPAERGTKRGNSGIYLQGRYELQVLDSFGSNLATGADTMAPKRECGAIWEHFGPALNMSFPPLSWQTYDIAFTAARFDASGMRTSPAIVTARWNGQTIQDARGMLNHTLAGDLEGAAAGPLRFQGYGDPVYYRNIWVTEGASSVRPPVRSLRQRQGHLDAQSVRLATMDGRKLGTVKESRPACGHYLYSGPQGGGEITYSRGAIHEF